MRASIGGRDMRDARRGAWGVGRGMQDEEGMQVGPAIWMRVYTSDERGMREDGTGGCLLVYPNRGNLPLRNCTRERTNGRQHSNTTTAQRITSRRLTIEVARVRDGLLARPRAARGLIRRARPVPTDRDIKNETLRQKVAHDVALCVRERRGGRAPRTRVGLLRGDVRRDRVAVEEPHVDAVLLERVRVHPARLHVEEVPEGVVALERVRAARVVPVRRLALRPEQVRERFGRLVDHAPRAAVQRHLVLHRVVDVLCIPYTHTIHSSVLYFTPRERAHIHTNDIDLARLRPVLASTLR